MLIELHSSLIKGGKQGTRHSYDLLLAEENITHLTENIGGDSEFNSTVVHLLSGQEHPVVETLEELQEKNQGIFGLRNQTISIILIGRDNQEIKALLNIHAIESIEQVIHFTNPAVTSARSLIILKSGKRIYSKEPLKDLRKKPEVKSLLLTQKKQQSIL